MNLSERGTPARKTMFFGVTLIALAVLFPALSSFFGSFENDLSQRIAGGFFLLFYLCSFVLIGIGALSLMFGAVLFTLQYWHRHD